VIRRALPLPALVLALAAGGCASAPPPPPDGAWFDVVLHPAGGIPANLGYYGGVAAWSPVGFVLGGLLPEPANGIVVREPGRVLGTGLGVVVGAPFHLVALPFGPSGPTEEPEPVAREPAPGPGREEGVARTAPRAVPRPR
jgi:hypothetical protein